MSAAETTAMRMSPATRPGVARLSFPRTIGMPISRSSSGSPQATSPTSDTSPRAQSAPTGPTQSGPEIAGGAPS